MMMAAVEVAELAPRVSSKSSQTAGMMHEVRDVYNHGTTLNSVAGNVHYHTHIDQRNHLESSPAPPPSTNQSELPSQLYSRILMKKGRGYPLMDASLPNELPEEYQMHGVMIGDVGIVTQDGYFDVFFNICEDADGPINGGWVPEGFTKLKRPPDNRHNYRRGRSCKAGGWIVGADTVQVVSHPLIPGAPADTYQFDCGPGEGAVLALPSGASKEDLIHCKDFIEYASRHGVSWYDFAKNRLGRDFANGSIYLITGYDKTQAWGAASFLTTSRFGMVFSDSEWKEPGQSSVKEGSSCQSNGTFPENQCVFLRGYKVTLNNRVLARIFGISVAEISPMDKFAPEPEQWRLFSIFMATQGLPSILPSILTRTGTSATNNQPEHSSSVTGMVPPLSPLIHPSNLVNLYLLNKFPDCDLAITHDSVWCSYLEVESEYERGYSILSLLKYIDAECAPTQAGGAIYLDTHLQEDTMDVQAESLAPTASEHHPTDSGSGVSETHIENTQSDSAPKKQTHWNEGATSETSTAEIFDSQDFVSKDATRTNVNSPRTSPTSTSPPYTAISSHSSLPSTSISLPELPEPISSDSSTGMGGSQPESAPGTPSQQLPDPQIMQALRSKDRLWVLKLGELMEGLINDRGNHIELSPSTSYQRLLVHRCSAYYKLTPESEYGSKIIVVRNTAGSRIPACRLSELVPPEMSALPSFRIMRRSPNEFRGSKASSPMGSAASDADLSDNDPFELEADRPSGGSNISAATAKKDTPFKQPEAAYNEDWSRFLLNFVAKKEEFEGFSVSPGSLSDGGVSVSDEDGSTPYGTSAGGMLTYPVLLPPISPPTVPPAIGHDGDSDDSMWKRKRGRRKPHRGLAQNTIDDDSWRSVDPIGTERTPHRELVRREIIKSMMTSDETTSDAMSMASGSTGFSNASMRTTSTAATSVSSGSSSSWRKDLGSSRANAPLPLNIKVMDGIPWELDPIPRRTYPTSPARQSKPWGTKLGPITETARAAAIKQGSAGQGSSASTKSSRHHASTSSTSPGELASVEDEFGGAKKGLAPDQALASKGKRHAPMVVACVQCRARKIRCDGAKPVCSNCTMRSSASDCEYDAVPKHRGPDETPKVHKGQINQLAKMLSSLRR